jgi:guanine nucleotide-binding protein subunit alpha
MKALIKAAAHLNATLLPANESLASLIANLSPTSFEPFLSLALSKAYQQLWADPAIQLAYSRRGDFYNLNDNMDFFFNKVPQIAALGEEYQPSNEDILKTRVRTTGVTEHYFNLEAGTRLLVVDVGGQRNERRKWIHCFEHVNNVLFCAALDDYCLSLREDDQGSNRMIESLSLFGEVIESQWFKNTPIILFLNKVDLFRQKLPSHPLSLAFSTYTGGSDFNLAIEFITNNFLAKNRNKARQVYPHITVAIDTELFRTVMEHVKETLLLRRVTEYNNAEAVALPTNNRIMV